LKKVISVFGSSLPAFGDPEYEEAYRLGRKLSGAGFNVCTGGYQGIMDAVSRGAAELRAEVIGVTLIHTAAKKNRFISTEIQTDNIFDRLEKLIETGDGFIILSGGTGTLLEAAALWELINKGMKTVKPVASTGNMWRYIVQKIDARMRY